jgi:hypothetical protein
MVVLESLYGDKNHGEREGVSTEAEVPGAFCEK